MAKRTFTLQERIFVVKGYFSTHSYKHVAETWSTTFNSDPPAKFNKTGSVADAPRSGRPKTVLNDYNRDAVVTVNFKSVQLSFAEFYMILV